MENMEKWIRWEPIEGLASKYYVKAIHDKINVFKITLVPLRSDDVSIEILFKDGVYAYSSTDESFNIKLIHELDEKHGLDFYKNWTLFKVNNSRYLSWLSDESYEWSNAYGLMHFSIIASNNAVDIMANYEPIVRFIKSYQKIKETLTRQQFGLELKEKIKNKEDAGSIGDWAFNMHYEHRIDIDDDFQDFLINLGCMSADPQFEYSYEELNKIADRLITGEDVKL